MFFLSLSNKNNPHGRPLDTQLIMLWRTKSHHSQNSEQDLSRTTSASKNDAAVSASQAAGTAWLAGHLHHLTPEQEAKLEEFKKVCAEHKYYTPAVKAADGVETTPASHGDATMLYVDSHGEGELSRPI